ncbi:MAG: GspH/FimT family pseudopilin [Wenzhouxiangellaceae bacterium]|nr:GspH/FimT family pseudopilin [Wenzhouxiangellaceae bacterium]
MSDMKSNPPPRGRTPVALRSSAGFTIVEIFLAIVVAAILLAAALPNFVTFVQNNRLSAQSNEVVAAFQLARSEALRRGQRVDVCASSDGASCGGNWNQGWLVLAAPGTNDEEVLRVWPSPGDDFSFEPASSTHGYDRNGFAATGDAQIDLTLGECSGNNARRILLENTGRVAVQRIACQ